MNQKLRKSEHSTEADRRTPGSIFSFLPADGGSRAGAVAKRLSRTLTEGLGPAVLLADFDSGVDSPEGEPGRVSTVGGMEVLQARGVDPRRLGGVLGSTRAHYSIVCADLTGATESQALETLRASDAIFIVASGAVGSAESAAEKASWLERLALIERGGLLLNRAPEDCSLQRFEDIAGVPLCSLAETSGQIRQLATWLAANTIARIESGTDTLTVAV